MTKRALERYAAKRKFTRTPEPPPKTRTAQHGPLLFVVQKHAAQRLHYDFRLELDGVLKSWAVPKGPSLDPSDKRLAVETEDHPFDYASFEGVIPAKQYGAGNVIVWDCGVYSPDEDRQYEFRDRRNAETRLRDGYTEGKLSFTLLGEKLKGSFTLVRTSTPKQWLLIKHRDRFAQPNDVLARAESVLTGRTLDDFDGDAEQRQIDAERLVPHGPREAMPKTIAPMLAEIGDGAHSDRRYAYEPKLDGYRAIAFVTADSARLQSRRGIDYTAAFPELTSDLTAQAVDGMIVDGEIIAMTADGRPSFNALQNRAKLSSPREIAQAQRETTVAFLCFDLLHFAGIDVRSSPYVDRRRYLAQCLAPSRHLQLVHASDDAVALFDAAIASGFEGIVAKKKDSQYVPGKRSSAWLKIKAVNSSEFVIGGYTQGKGSRSSLGAVLLGYWDGGKLRYVGHAGSGLDSDGVDDLRERLTKLATHRCPFSETPPRHRPTTWVKPELVAEISFSDWTPDGNLRAPVFVRLRDDRDARSIGEPESIAAARERPRKASAARKRSRSGADDDEAPPAVTAAAKRGSATQRRDTTSRTATDSSAEIDSVLEQLGAKANRIDLQVGAARIRLTNLDRVYWPAGARSRPPVVTKRDLLRYLAGVSPYILPHLEDRPLTMIRMPEGIDGERFFQKHWSQEKPAFVETVRVFSGSKDEQHDYLLANNLPTLIWLGQVGTLEFHVWHSRTTLSADAVSQQTDFSSSLEALEASVLNYPDYLVFDIDPYIYSGKEAKGAEPELNKKGFATGRRVAFWLRDLLREMSLESVVKTSGKTGLHVFVPIERTVTFDQARTICEMVGRHLLRAHPREITMEWATVKRTGKIFIDFNMNVRGKTLNVAFSPRGVVGAPISMPLTWEELEAAEPTDFTLLNAMQRLDRTGDRWHDVLSQKQSLARAFASVARTKS